MSNLFDRLDDKFSEFNDESLFLELRKESFAYFKELGLPTRKNEDWKYTNIGFLNKLKFDYNPIDFDITKEEIDELLIPNINENLLVFVNGHYISSLSKIIDTEGITIDTIKNAYQNNSELINSNYSKHFDNKDHALSALNTALSEDGVFVILDKNIELSNPIHILNISKTVNLSTFSNTKNLIFVGDNSKLKIIQSNHTLGDNSSVLNTSNEFILGKNSKLYNYNFQNDGNNNYVFSTSQATQEKDSLFSDTTITLSGKIVRNDLRTKLNGENTEVFYNGLYLIDEDSHVDNHTFVDHIAPHCHSNEFYKGIIDGKAKAVFNGKVMVRQDAQKTDAYQQNRNLVLSDDAAIYTKPELEIYADDVKCSHGATTGKIEEDKLFYMMQRGLSRESAKSLLMYTFCAEIISRIDIPEMKNYIEELVKKRLNIEFESLEE